MRRTSVIVSFLLGMFLFKEKQIFAKGACLLGIILGVDRFLDMCRTTLNVTGDLAAAAVVSRGEADPPPELLAD